MIDQQGLEKKLSELQTQQQQLIAQVNMVTGAIQLVESLLKEEIKSEVESEVESTNKK